MMRGRRPVTARSARTIAALDVGTSKVAALIAEVGPNEETPRVIGVHQLGCKGLVAGLVADMEVTERAIRQAMEKAERNAGVTVDEVTVAVSAGGLDSDVASVEVDIGGNRIERADIDNVLSEGRARIDAGARTILHAEPAIYTLDGKTPVMNPLGFHADTLGVDIHIVTADTPPIRNLDVAVRNADLGVRSIVAAPVASGIACLDEEERDLGVALVEIGAGVTNIAVYARGMLVGLAAVAMGSDDITADIAAALATRRQAAERLKAVKGSASSSPRDNHEYIEVPPLGPGEPDEGTRVPRAQLVAIIRARLDALFAAVGEELDGIGFRGPRGCQVVLTGGGAELTGIADYAEGALSRQVRIGRPRGLAGLPQAQQSSAFAALAGLALFTARAPGDLWVGETSVHMPAPAHSAFGRMMQLLRANI